MDGDEVANGTDPLNPADDTRTYFSVGGDVYPVEKNVLIAPLVALAIVISAGGIFLVRRKLRS